jgi:hypothetical protein
MQTTMTNLKNIILLFLTCLFSGLAFGQQDSLLRGDSTWFSGGGGFITVQLVLFKDPATFYYTYRDCMWVHAIRGDYSINGDSIHLKCTTNCDDWKRSFVGTIVIEKCSYQPKNGSNFNFLSTADDTLTNFEASILLDTTDHSSPCSKYIEITSADTVVAVQRLTDCNATCFTVIIPVDMLHPEMVMFYDKAGTIENNNIRLDDRLLKYIQLRPYDGKTKKKKRKKE